MIKNKGIVIKNIYYMLTYAFRVLKQSNYEKISTEEFENIYELFAAILAKAIAQQLKQGLYREYIAQSDNLSVLRGKLDINGTLRNRLQRKMLLSCEYDELSENNIFNQILKTTATILLREPSVGAKFKTELKRAFLFFDRVDKIDPSGIQWNKLQYQRNNQSYKMLMNICYFVLNGLLLTTEQGQYKMASFLDEQSMSQLFEKFVLEYYRFHYPSLQAKASQVKWNLDDGYNNFLPIMQTDITLKHGDKILIIDTKYYSQTMQTHYQYGRQTIHSNNLYQIFTYVKNQDVGNTGNVAGMILYAKTNESITPDCDFKMSGNTISVKTLDLNTAFSDIATQLDIIAESYFPNSYQEEV